jgi:asparagine synthetase B (glutamine-hydrolysing)
MCGICGQLVFDPVQSVDGELLRQLNATLRHRGPDSEGYYLKDGVGLAISRLAIIDVAAATDRQRRRFYRHGLQWRNLRFRELRADLQDRDAIQNSKRYQVIVVMNSGAMRFYR